MKTSKIWLAIIAVFLGACDLFIIKEKNADELTERKPVVRVFDKYLYQDDLQGVASGNLSAQDSIKRVESYLKNWVKKQLLISEAADKIEFDEAEIERKVLDYRYALMVYEYEKYYVNRELSKNVTDLEIEDYYNGHQENFELKQNIIRGIFMKIPKEAPNIPKVRKLIKSKTAKNREELKSYCFQFATSYSLEDSTWVNFGELIQNTPLIGIPNKVQYLSNNNYIETEDENFFYFFNIYDYRISEDISPLEFVRDDIENIIINKRKIQLANRLEEDIYRQADSKNDFEFFQNK